MFRSPRHVRRAPLPSRIPGPGGCTNTLYGADEDEGSADGRWKMGHRHLQFALKRKPEALILLALPSCGSYSVVECRRFLALQLRLSRRRTVRRSHHIHAPLSVTQKQRSGASGTGRSNLPTWPRSSAEFRTGADNMTSMLSSHPGQGLALFREDAQDGQCHSRR